LIAILKMSSAPQFYRLYRNLQHFWQMNSRDGKKRVILAFSTKALSLCK